MTTLADILAGVERELGPDASDSDVKAKVLETIEGLPDADRSELLEEMVQLASTSELAHLNELGEGETGPETGV